MVPPLLILNYKRKDLPCLRKLYNLLIRILMNKSLLLAVLTGILAPVALAGDKTAWKQRSIYQVLTDRFAKSNGDTTPCSNLSTYCGGTW